MKFKTAMDVRIGIPNEHLSGPARDEINQPMYATSVGLIMRGFEYLETYKKSFVAGRKEDFIKSKKTVNEYTNPGKIETQAESQPLQEEAKVTLADKIKDMFMKMFEVEDQSITKM